MQTIINKTSDKNMGENGYQEVKITHYENAMPSLYNFDNEMLNSLISAFYQTMLLELDENETIEKEFIMPSCLIAKKEQLEYKMNLDINIVEEHKTETYLFYFPDVLKGDIITCLRALAQKDNLYFTSENQQNEYSYVDVPAGASIKTPHVLLCRLSRSFDLNDHPQLKRGIK